MFAINQLRISMPRIGYISAASGCALALLLQISCSANKTQESNTQGRQDNANTAPPLQSTPEATPATRNDQTALNLVHVIHRWCDYKEEAYLETGLKLSSAWRRKFPTDPDYYPDGVDQLINRLKQVPDWKEKAQIKNLHSGYFNPDTGIKTAGDLYDFIELNRNFPANK
jgi:hypothetical protein